MGHHSPGARWILMADLQKCTDDTENKQLHLNNKEKTEGESEVLTENRIGEITNEQNQ